MHVSYTSRSKVWGGIKMQSKDLKTDIFNIKFLFKGPPVPSNDEVETITFDQPHSGQINLIDYDI